MLERFFPKNYGFFELFERHVTIGLEAVQEMHTILLDIPANQAKISHIKELEHECDSIVHMTIDLMRKTFIAPLDRDEIRDLIHTLDDIVDFVHAASCRLTLFEIVTVPKEAIMLSDVLVKADEKVALFVKMLRNMKESKEVSTFCKEIHTLENEGDDWYRAGLAGLFHNNYDPFMVIKYKEIYDLLEQAVDSCEDVADVIEDIIIEHVG
jgi:uncharacterized protein Yka (UPF0111/DUF47 family)